MTNAGAPPPPEMMGQFFDLLTAHFRFQFLAAAADFDLFTKLSEHPGLTRAEIGERIGLRERPTRVLLLGLASLQLVKKEGDRYSNSPFAEAMLVAGRPGNTLNFVKMERLRYRGMSWLPESLRENTNLGVREYPGEGDTLYERVAGNEELRPLFHSVMGSITEAVVGELTARFDFGKYRHVLDVGGGASAVYARALARRYPNLRITILDLPAVAELARERIRAEGLEGRVDAVGLDCLRDEFPAGADGILFSHFLEMWSPERIQELLKKAARAVAPGGGVMIVTPASNDDETGPWIAAHLSAYFQAIATTEAMVYTEAEFRTWVAAAGLTIATQMQLHAAYFIEATYQRRTDVAT